MAFKILSLRVFFLASCCVVSAVAAAAVCIELLAARLAAAACGAPGGASAAQLCLACVDEAGHGLSASVVWLGGSALWPLALAACDRRAMGYTGWRSVRHYFLDGFKVCLLACLMDVDHFLAARSLSLRRAVLLPRRPPFHAVVAVPLGALAMFALAHILRRRGLVPPHKWAVPPPRRVATMTWCAWTAHQLRDARRRGLWLWPAKYSTAPLGLFAYVFGCALVAVATGELLLHAQWSGPSQPPTSHADDVAAVKKAIVQAAAYVDDWRTRSFRAPPSAHKRSGRKKPRPKKQRSGVEIV